MKNKKQTKNLTICHKKQSQQEQLRMTLFYEKYYITLPDSN